VADIVAADRRELALFVAAAEARLEELDAASAVPAPGSAAEDVPTRTWRRRASVALPVVPLVGALAVSAAAATGALPLRHTDRPTVSPPATAGAAVAPASQDSLESSFRHFVDVLDGNPSADQVLAAADRLHEQLAHLIADAPANPKRAAAIARLLSMEQSLLMEAQPPGAAAVLDETRRLAARLSTIVPSLSPTAVPTLVVPLPAPTTTDHHTAKSSPSPTPSKKSSAPAPSPSSTPPSQSSTSSPSDRPAVDPFGALPY
jgi:hypothetical protein